MILQFFGIPTGANAEKKTPTGQGIQRRDPLGKRDGMMLRHQTHTGAYPQIFGYSRGLSEKSKGLDCPAAPPA